MKIYHQNIITLFFQFLLIMLWNKSCIVNAQPLPLQHFSGSVTDVGFTPDSQFVIIARQTAGNDNLSNKPIFFWDIVNQSVNLTIEPFERIAVRSFDISEDGNYLGIASNSIDAFLWNIKTNQLVQKFGPHPVIYDSKGSFLRAGVTKIKITPNNQWVLTLGEDRNAYLWNTTSGNHLGIFSNSNVVLDFAFSPNLDFIIVGNKVLDFDTFDVLHTLIPRSNTDINQLYTNAVSISSNGKYLYLAQRIQSIYVPGIGLKIEYFVSKWNPNTGNIINIFEGFPAFITDIIISTNDKFLFTSIEYNGLWVMDAENGTILKKYDDLYAPVEISPDGKYALTGGPDGGASLWLVEDLLGQSKVDNYELYK